MKLAPCTERICCWEWWQPASRVMQSDVEAAFSLLRALVAAYSTAPELPVAVQIREAALMLTELRGVQWRQMTRPPFDFPFHRPGEVTWVKDPRSTIPPKRPSAADLMELI